MTEYLPKSLGRNVEVELYLSSYATKTDLKKATGVDASELAQKIDLASLNLDVDELRLLN